MQRSLLIDVTLTLLVLSLCGCPSEPQGGKAPSTTGPRAARDPGADPHDHGGDIPEVEGDVYKGPGKGAQIRFAHATVDLGEVEHGTLSRHSFPFTNAGDQDLVIRRVRPSCQCVAAASSRERIPPGEGAEIVITYDSHGRSGADMKHVHVYTNGGWFNLRIDVNVKVNPHPIIRLLPRRKNLGVLAPGEIALAEIDVQNIGEKDLLILGVSTPNGVEVTLPSEAKLPPGRRARLRIRVTPSPAGGVQHFPMTLRSTDPYRNPYRFHAVAYVSAPSGPSLHVNPEGLKLGPIGAGPSQREIALYNSGGEDLLLQEARPVDGDPRLVLELPPGTRVPPGESVSAVISFAGGGAEGAIRSRVVVLSNDPVFPEKTYDIFARVGEGHPRVEGPSLLLGHTEWDLGAVDTGTSVTHALRCFNRGSLELRISALTTYVEFTPLEIEVPPPIPPGGSGEIRFTLVPGAPEGPLDFDFQVESNDPASLGVGLRVMGYVREGAMAFPEGSRRLTLLCVGDEAGEIQACGCGEANLGGLDRLGALVEQVRSGGPAVLLLGAGDLFGVNEPHFRLRAELAAEVLSRIGCDAVTPGEMDFAFGAEFLKDTLGAARVPLTTLNVVSTKADRVFAPPLILREVGGMKVALIGVLEPEIFEEGDSGLKAIDPLVALHERLPGPRAEVDLVVLLSHLGRKRTIKLLKEVRGIDVAVVGHSEDGLEEPIRVGRSVVVENGGAGRTLGRLEIALAPDGQIYPVWERMPLGKEIEPDPELKILMEKYRNRLRELPAPPSLELEESPYVASAACAACHPQAYETWADSKHAKAFKALRDVGSHYDPECIRCHVVGYRLPGGFAREDVTPRRSDVGCEVKQCHGPGRKHLEAEGGAEVPYHRAEIRNLCDECHTSDRSPGFDFDESWEKIAHGSD